MFEYLSEIDQQLPLLKDDIEKSIRMKNGNTMVSIQTFCEFIMKWICRKERFFLNERETLGSLLNNERLYSLLRLHGFDSSCLMSINARANSIKHDGNSFFSQDEIENATQLVYKLSMVVHKKYASSSKNMTYDHNYVSNLVLMGEEEQEMLKKIVEELNQNSEKHENELEELEFQRAEIEKRESKYDELEKEILQEKSKVEKLSKDLVEKQKQLDCKELEYKEKNSESLGTLNQEIQNLKKEIKELRKIISESTKNTFEKNDKLYYDEKIKTENDIEIERVKSRLENSRENEKKPLNSGVLVIPNGFTSSYVHGDYPFTITGISPKVNSSSKYKSFYAVLHNLLQRGDLIKQSMYLKAQDMDESDLVKVYRIQMCVLSLVRNNKLDDNIWNINYINGSKNIVETAVADIFYWMNLLVSLSQTTYTKPLLVVSNTSIREEHCVNLAYGQKASQEKDIYRIIDYNSSMFGTSHFQLWVEDEIQYNIESSNKQNLLTIMEEIFGFKSFNDGQYEILEHTMKGNNTIGILPTAGGKSLIYQLSSLLQPKMTLVIDPINSLIKDQIDGLRNKFGITRCLNLTSDNVEKGLHQDLFRHGNALFVFASPERLQNGEFRQILYNLAEKKTIERIVLDEVHCLSEWGHDFRISYLMLAETLTKYCGNRVRYLGLTATASANVIKDLMVELQMDENDVIFLKKLRRENLTFTIRSYKNVELLQQALRQKIKDVDPTLNGSETNAIIVFSRTKSGQNPTSIGSIMNALQPLYASIMDKYHGDYKESQDRFVYNEASLLIATKAFGMGIDKPNIRSTIHFGIPSSFESFYQEAGRAGRDNKSAECCLFTYDVPEYQKAYVDSFFDLKTDINNLKKITSISQGNVDLSTNFYFLTKDLETPLQEKEETIALYKSIHSKVMGGPVIIYDPNWKFEKYLYILFKLGIVLNWEKNYVTKSYLVIVSSYYKEITYIKSCAYQYISQYGDSSDIIEKIDKISEFAQLPDLIFYVRSWYFDKFVQAKRNQLANMYDKVIKFANRDCSKEIQAEIDGYFDLSNIILKSADGYSLKFEDETLENVITYVTNLKPSQLNSRVLEMERILESITNTNISIYLSLILLKNNRFDHRNGQERFESTYMKCKESEKTEIYRNIAQILYPSLEDNQKKELIDAMYRLDVGKFKSTFLSFVKHDVYVKLYWLPFINKSITAILGEEDKYEKN